MKMKFVTQIIAAAGLALLAGCATPPGPFTPQDTTRYTLENTESFVLLDKPTQVSITCTGLQVNAVFKDEKGFSTGDETPFQTLILAENSTEAVRFTAMNTLAKKYTIRVRQAR
jgi:hypothetical protein